MAATKDLRDNFDEQLAELDERRDLTRDCPGCGGRGIPAGGYKDDYLECPDNDCRTLVFDVYKRGDD